MPAVDEKTAWKNISHKDRGNVKTTITFKETQWDPNSYYSYRKEIYCIMPDGQLYMMVPIEVPTIGYQLVTTEVTKKAVTSGAQGFSEYEAINRLFIRVRENSQKDASKTENKPEEADQIEEAEQPEETPPSE